MCRRTRREVEGVAVVVERVPEAEQGGASCLPKPLIGRYARLWVAQVHAGEHDYSAYPGQVSLECVPLSEPPHPQPRPRAGGNVGANISNPSPQGHCLLPLTMLPSSPASGLDRGGLRVMEQQSDVKNCSLAPNHQFTDCAFTTGEVYSEKNSPDPQKRLK